MSLLIALALACPSTPTAIDTGSPPAEEVACDDPTQGYLDEDGDGVGGLPSGDPLCELPDGLVTGAGDCDDADPAVLPGAAELCNERDDDCDGTIDEGFDADGDGVSTCAGDCDDTDPTLATATAEVCGDGVDQDCDGVDPRCGLEGAYGVEDATTVLTGTVEDFGYMLVASDVDDDGRADLAIGAPAGKAGFVARGPFAAGTLDTSELSLTYTSEMTTGFTMDTTDLDHDGQREIAFALQSPQAVVVVPGSGGGGAFADHVAYQLDAVAVGSGYAMEFADLTGDGEEDAVVGDYTAAGDGQVYVHEGPLSGHDQPSQASATLTGGGDYVNLFGRDLAAGGDHNGDGIGDLVVADPYQGEDHNGAGTLFVYFGPVADGTSADADAWIAGDANERLGWGQNVLQFDADGDGRSDVYSGASRGYAGVWTTVSAGGLHRSDAWAQFIADSLQSGTLAVDLDDSGRPDLFVGVPRIATGYLWRDPSAGIHDATDAAATFVGEPSGMLGTSAAAGDFDADGTLDLAIGAPGEGWMIEGNPDPTPGTVFIFANLAGG